MAGGNSGPPGGHAVASRWHFVLTWVWGSGLMWGTSDDLGTSTREHLSIREDAENLLVMPMLVSLQHPTSLVPESSVEEYLCMYLYAWSRSLEFSASSLSGPPLSSPPKGTSDREPRSSH